jgi:hypothetical protein
MVRHVLADEAGDEVVAVVVARLHAQLSADAGGVAGGLQQFGRSWLGEEFVGIALVDQQRQALRCLPKRSARTRRAPAMRPISPR